MATSSSIRRYRCSTYMTGRSGVQRHPRVGRDPAPVVADHEDSGEPEVEDQLRAFWRSSFAWEVGASLRHGSRGRYHFADLAPRRLDCPVSGVALFGAHPLALEVEERDCPT